MKENSPKDTAWLALESYEFLTLAAVWPTSMVRVFNLVALLCLALFSYGVVDRDYPIVIGFLSALGFIGYKLYIYYGDINLIQNELMRRERECEL